MQPGRVVAVCMSRNKGERKTPVDLVDVRENHGIAENITTQGIDLPALAVGTRLAVGETLLEVTQIGKECHTRCAIYHQAGDCVMPKEGIFARVVEGGTIKAGDLIEFCT